MGGAEWPDRDLRGAGGEVPSFVEVQKFSDYWWIKAMAVVLALVGGVPMAWGLVQQIIFRKPFGNHPTSDMGLVLSAALVVGIMALSLGVMLSMRLVTMVRRDGLYLRFAPLHRKYRVIPWKEIARAESMVYRPLLDYGGWGIKYGRKGKVYNVRGNQGVLLTFGDGKTLMVGSQRADELAAAIAKRRG